jgi:murein hydrolase activator
MANIQKSLRLQRLGWLLAGLALFAVPAAGVETGTELEATREALRALEREQQQRLREIERLEERVAEVARRSQDLRGEHRQLATALVEHERAVAERQREVDQRERDLAAAREESRQLLRGQWLRERHRGWVPADERMARHQRVLDARVQARREQALTQIAVQLQALTAARDHLAAARDELLGREIEARRVLREIARQEEELAALLTRVQQQVESDALEMERLERNAGTLEGVVRRMEARTAAAQPACGRGPVCHPSRLAGVPGERGLPPPLRQPAGGRVARRVARRGLRRG